MTSRDMIIQLFYNIDHKNYRQTVKTYTLHSKYNNNAWENDPTRILATYIANMLSTSLYFHCYI